MALLPLDEIRKELDAELKQNRQACTEVSSELDKIIVSVSSGALVFSMTFIQYLAPQRLWLPVLFLSWLAFGAAIFVVVYSIRQFQRHLVATIIRHDNLRTKLDELAAKNDPMADFTKREHLLKDVGGLNNLAIACFISGLLLLGIFVGRNLISPQPVPPNNNRCLSSTRF